MPADNVPGERSLHVMRAIIYELVYAEQKAELASHLVPLALEICKAGVDYINVSGTQKPVLYVVDSAGTAYVCDELTPSEIQQSIQALNKKGYTDFKRHLFRSKEDYCCFRGEGEEEALREGEEPMPPEVDPDALDGWDEWGGTSDDDDPDDPDDADIRGSLNDIPDDEPEDVPVYDDLDDDD